MAATRREYFPQASSSPLDIMVVEQGTTTTISLHGECDLAQQPAMRTAINDMLERFPECVVLDLSGLDFIDAAGMHGVIELHKRSKQQRARLVIIPGSRRVQRTFELVGLSELLPFLSHDPGARAAKPRNARPCAAGSGGSLSPPPATPAARPSRGRRR
jgi:anti-anti-sigma factor